MSLLNFGLFPALPLFTWGPLTESTLNTRHSPPLGAPGYPTFRFSEAALVLSCRFLHWLFLSAWLRALSVECHLLRDTSPDHHTHSDPVISVLKYFGPRALLYSYYMVKVTLQSTWALLGHNLLPISFTQHLLMTRTHVKICSISLIVSEMPIKTTVG